MFFGGRGAHIFTASAHWAYFVSKSQYPSACVSVSCCAIAENPLPGGLETSGQKAYRKYAPAITKLSVFFFLCFDKKKLHFDIFQVFGLCEPAYCA